MEAELIQIRDAFYVGRFPHGRDLVAKLKNSPHYNHLDSLTKLDIEEWDLRLALAAGLNVSSSDKETSEVLSNVAAALNPSTSNELRKAAWLALKSLPVPRNPSLRGLYVYTLGSMTLSGELLSHANEVGDLNSIVADLCQCQTTEAMFLEMLILVLSDRVDLATKLTARLLINSDESTLPTLAQVWNAIAKGEWHEAYLSLGDLENMLDIQSGDDVPAFLEHLKGVTLIHQGLFEDAATVLLKVVEQTGDPVAMMNLVCALQNEAKNEEAEVYTERLKECLPSSHPYRLVLQAHESLAREILV